MMAKKYYAVRIGKVPGVYLTWDACKEMVNGYPGAVYKSFPTKEEAEQFVESAAAVSQQKELPQGDRPYAFVDGSYNPATKVYGYGGYLVKDGKQHVLQGADDKPELVGMNNIAGELAGSMAAVEKALELGLKELDIYYDCQGIEMWATGEWKRNEKGTIAYYDYMQSVKDKIQIHFIKVKGHSNVKGNEDADKLARQAVGIED